MANAVSGGYGGKQDCFPAKAGIQTGLPPSRENKKAPSLDRDLYWLTDAFALPDMHLPGGGRGGAGMG
jgi:hypothetical protein